MRKILLGFFLMMMVFDLYALTYACYRYVNDRSIGTWISVEAFSKSEAEKKFICA